VKSVGLGSAACSNKKNLRIRYGRPITITQIGYASGTLHCM